MFPDYIRFFSEIHAECGEIGRKYGDKVENYLFFGKQFFTLPPKVSNTAVVTHVWLVTLTKARPTHKHSQQSQSLSYWCMVFAEISWKSTKWSRKMCDSTSNVGARVGVRYLFVCFQSIGIHSTLSLFLSFAYRHIKRSTPQRRVDERGKIYRCR